MNLSALFLAIFIIGTILFIFLMSGGVPGSLQSILYRSIPASMNLRSFLKTESKSRKRQSLYLFSEEPVISMGHKFKGRFDQAVFRSGKVPRLELIIERKFPTKYLPSKIREEDMFQAGLYALAIQESGVSCSNTRLVTVYCLQDNAMTCAKKRNTTDCVKCNLGKVFTRKYKQKSVLKDLEILDEIWFHSRKPIANPDEKCRACPYSKNGKCQYSIY
ncbi:MAG: hypothetical protein BAJATHORv1_40086 [Candidatus Thorarchaeota archaeon]|nr:MAG: hypothetical protein BAJATHORv1_40086 [Candidatus Thorarchaeota archaeon]